MKDTSFGKMAVILEDGGKPRIEHLVFEREGRPHKHLMFETFYVLSGSGTVVIGNERISVEQGDLVSIPPKTNHWMVPDGTMTGFLWYHDEKARLKT